MNQGTSTITPDEREMMRQAYRFLSQYSNPPANQAPDSVAWWDAAVRDVTVLDAVWNGHPLMRGMLTTLYAYIEWKAKAKSQEGAYEQAGIYSQS